MNLDRRITLEFWKAVEAVTRGDKGPLVAFVGRYPIAVGEWRRIVAGILNRDMRVDRRRRKTKSAALAEAFAAAASRRVNGLPTNREICEAIAPGRDPDHVMRTLRRYWSTDGGAELG